MATIKSFTSLEQSKKLAEILPFESADMYYALSEDESMNMINFGKTQGFFDKTQVAWSLSALLGVLPFHLIVNNQRYVFSMNKGLDKDGETYMFRYNGFNTDVCLYATDYYNNPIDACVAMVEKLHELNLL